MLDLTKAIQLLKNEKRWTQDQLAKALKTTQQTVSRWEAKTTRPHEHMLAKLHAFYPSISLEDWHRLAGRMPSPPDRVLDAVLPIYNLTPGNFELFCKSLIQLLYPQAEVHVFGNNGDKQNGVDIYAIFPDNKVFTFQCKRIKYKGKFGAEKVSKAIGYTDFEKILAGANLHITRQIIVFTKEATADERKVVLTAPGWDLWDLYDIASKIRDMLSPIDKKQLVYTYFPSRMESFLGIPRIGPWQNALEYLEKPGISSQHWPLVGRKDALHDLQTFLEGNKKIVVIIGRGGLGKTKLLYEIAKTIEKKVNPPAIYCAAEGSAIEAKDTDDIRDGTIIIVDDVHSRDDLRVLLEGIARNNVKCKIILTTRPYGEKKIASIIMSSPIATGEETTYMHLDNISKEETTQLALEVLKENNGKIELASAIAELTLDCPLLTIIAAKIVAKDAVFPLQVTNKQDFRAKLLTGFRDTLSGELGDEINKEDIREILDLIALTQPITSTDKEFITLATKTTKKPIDVIDRHIQFLEEAGILIRRREQLRIAPDLLADHIREVACFNPLTKQTTHYADRIFTLAEGKLLRNSLKNISQLDWRLSYEDSDSPQTALLDGIWETITREFKEGGILQRQSILEVISDCAYYQPDRALKLLKFAIENPTTEIGTDSPWARDATYTDYVIKKIPNLLKDISYNLQYLHDAANLLWTIAKNDTRPLNQFPEHPIRILEDLISIKPRKPLEYTATLLGLIPRWINDTDRGIEAFNILDKVLDTETDISEFDGNKIILKSYFIHPDQVLPFRKKALDIAFDIIARGNLTLANRAIQTINNSMGLPRGIGGAQPPPSTIEQWILEIGKVLERIEFLVKNQKLDSILLFSIMKSVNHWTKSSKTEIETIATRVIEKIPIDIEFEITRAFTDNWGDTINSDRKITFEEREKALTDKVQALASALAEQFTENEILKLLEREVSKIQESSRSQSWVNPKLIIELLGKIPHWGITYCEYVLLNPNSPLAVLLSKVLSMVFQSDTTKAIELTKQIIASGNKDLQLQASSCLGWGLQTDLLLKKPVLELIDQFLMSTEVRIKQPCIHALYQIAERDKSLAFELLNSIDFQGSSVIAEETLGEFGQHNGPLTMSDIPLLQIDRFSKMLLHCPSIDDYHIKQFLSEISKRAPTKAVDLLKKRIQRATEIGTKEYRPLPFQSEREKLFRFEETKEYESILRDLRDWIFTESTEGWEHEYFGKELFGMVAGSYNGIVISILNEWLNSNIGPEIEQAAQLLAKAPHDFVWNNLAFVIDLLNRSYDFSDEIYQAVTGSIGSSLITGARSGIAGQPFPQDIEMRDKSEQILKTLNVDSPAHKFFDGVRRHSINEIQRHANKFDGRYGEI